MKDKPERVSKACDPCRSRKVKCNGERPCHNCHSHPSACTYRLRNRIRLVKRGITSTPGRQDAQLPEQFSASPSSPPLQAGLGEEPEGKRVHGPAKQEEQKPHPGVMASHPVSGTTPGPGSNSQLFYGPSSNFAFLQQLHRSLVFSHKNGQAEDRSVQEGGPLLDMFMQRSIFFGIPSQVDKSSLYLSWSVPLVDILPQSEAQAYLGCFEASTHPLLPFYSISELDQFLDHIYNNQSETPVFCQTRCLILAMLANGALQSGHTSLAETLFSRSRFEMTLCEDAGTLTAIHYSLVAAHYQLHMGRPNSAYLHFGDACRQAFAMGLHVEPPSRSARQESLQMQRTTMWCLYFHDRCVQSPSPSATAICLSPTALLSWHALSLGRKGGINYSDIARPFPEGQPLVAGLSKLAQIAEQGADVIYGKRYDSLRQMYSAAESIHGQLKEAAEIIGIGSAPERCLSDPVALHQLHHCE